MIYTLYMVILFGSPGNEGIPVVLKSPRTFISTEECEKEGKNFAVITDLPIKQAGVYCKPEPKRET